MTSKLVQMQARFQQKQMQEREEKLVKLYETQQQRAFEKVGRSSAGSTGNISTGPGKVRQMFDERRKAGIDRSYPLEPLKAKSGTKMVSQERKSNATIKSTVKSTSSISMTKNGKPIGKAKEVVHSVYNNNNGVESYEEHRYEEKKEDLLNGNEDSGFSLDDEEMPRYLEYDEPDRVPETRTNPIRMENAAVKKETRSPIKVNGVAHAVKSPAKINGLASHHKSNDTSKVVRSSPPRSDNSNVTVKKTASKPPTQRFRSSPSPKATTPTSTPPIKSPTGSASMSQRTEMRAPSAGRPSSKQPPKAAIGAVVRDDLAECTHCGRRFAADRLQKHEDVCAKTGRKKRKAYDATKHRVQGTELEAYVLKGGGGKQKSAPPPPKAKQGNQKKDWRRTHEEFIAAIRAAKEAQAHLAKGGKLADLPPPPPSSNPDYVQCPHCGRRFNESAAERHIPKCANYQFNKPKPAQKGTVGRR